MACKNTICNSIITALYNVVKFIIDIPYLIYMVVSSVLVSFWKMVTRKRKSLENEIILITGAASGLGKEITLNIANLSCNATLVLWDINQSRLEETATLCRKLGTKNIFTFVVDLAIYNDVHRTANLVREQVGSVTMLINNAGISPYKLFIDSDPETEEHVLRINLLSQMWTIREFLPAMIKSGGGHIVSTCSGVALARFRYLSSYVASKYGLRGFLETLRLEMKLHEDKPKIRITVIYPGWMETEMISGVTWRPRYECYPLLRMEPSQMADRIVDGILKEEQEIYFPNVLRHMLLLQWCMPIRYFDKLENHNMRDITVV